MKILLILLICCYVAFAEEIPQWYKSADLPSESYEVIGYGMGSNLSEAESNARNDIAKSIKVKVSSELSIISEAKSSHFKKDIKSKLNEYSAVTLTGLKKIKQECSNEKCFVALKYINLPFTSKIIKTLSSRICQKTMDNNSFLKNSPLIVQLAKDVGCSPKIDFFNNSGLLFAEILGEVFYLSPNEINGLFYEKRNDKINMTATNKKLKNKDTYILMFDVKSDGYLSLYQVSKRGETIVMIDNEKVVTGMKLKYPESDKYEGIEAVLPDGESHEIDMNVAVLCKAPILNNNIDKISKKVVVAEKGFGDLINIMKDCEIETIITEIVEE